MPVPAAQKLHILGDDHRALVVIAILVIPGADPQTPLDVDAAPFLEILGTDLPQPGPCLDLEPGGFFLRFACAGSQLPESWSPSGRLRLPALPDRRPGYR